MKLTFLVICISPFGSMQPALGDVPALYKINLVINYLPYRSTGNSGLQYDLLLDEILTGENIKVTRDTAPLGRARMLFESDLTSCHYPTSVRRLQNKKTAHLYVGSDPIDFFSLRLYTAQGSKTYTSVDDLKQGVFGYIAGSGFVRSIPELAKYWVPISAEKQLISMIELKRLDGFIGHHPDTAIALDTLGRTELLQVSDLKIGDSRTEAITLCHNTQEGRQFIDLFNRRLADLRSSGRLKEILGIHAELSSDGAN